MNPPNNEANLVRKWYACIFRGKKTSNLFIGKVIRRFLLDQESEGGYACALEVDCLQQKFGVTDCILREHDKIGKDIGIVPVKDVFIGPLKGIYRDNGKWEFPDYFNIKVLFETIKKVDRENLYNKFICSSVNL